MNDNREFVEEFLVESSENLDQLDRDLLALEQAPSDPERLASIFRTVHTIKGNSGFFGFSKLGALTHSGEHLLGRLRDGKLTLNDRVTGSLYSMVDAVRSILQSIEANGTEGDHDFRDLAQSLSAAAAEAETERAEAPQKPPPTEPRPAPPAFPQAPTASAAPPAPAPKPDVVAPAQASPPVAAAQASPSVAPAQASPSVAPAQAPPAVAATAATVTAAESSIRVDVGLLASILDLVGELVLARNQLRSIETEDPAVQAVSHRINSVTNALQETAVKTRMQPIDHLFSKFPRTVRDLAVTLGKEVQLVVDGADTELDRTLIESIRDPLTHLIRNAVDHGIESPADREAAGKPRAGRLLLRAFNESGQVTIEIEDDGRGIDVEAVRAKAIAKGLVTPEAVALLADDDVFQFIFEPGFSTAAAVTNVSGRGVGMDVVKTNIEAIGGTVDLHSRSGRGTTIRVRVPLTLAIMPALIVRCDHQRLAIPQAAVGELISLRPDRTGPRIEGLDGSPVIRVRGRLVPVVYLDEFLGLRGRTACRHEGTVVLLRVDDREFGLVIDGLRTVQSSSDGKPAAEAASLTTIVVKPIGPLLSQIGVYAGATVLGDGGVALILDLRGLLRMADLPPVEQPTAAIAVEASGTELADRYLVCRTGAGRRVAVPLHGVTRLETVTAADLQPVAGRQVVRRGEGFTPVVDVDSLLGGSATPSPAAFHVVVLGTPAGSIGLAVRQIVDVAAAESPLQADLAAAGVTGSLSLGGIATEVLDLADASIASPPHARL
jgi:two-component system chemotaxis sensor kinase CheA